MGKIKLNLASGAIVEKPLVSAFLANNTKYIILDNEMNGSMGLPIILVCKIIENKVTKIVDSSEWSIVKEYLKQIIAGNNLEYVSVDDVMNADDVYYTQLTLPVPSFDVLRNSYKVETKEEVNINIEPIVPIMEQPPVMDAQVQIDPIVPTPVVEQPVVAPVVAPVVEPIAPVVESPIINEPVVNIEPQDLTAGVPTFNMPMPPVEPVVEMAPIVEQPVVSTPIAEPIMPPVMEPIVPTPVVEQPVVTTEVETQENIENVFASQKEAFLEACENMFDALVQRFEKELENRKQ